MNLIQTEVSSYAESLDGFKPEYTPVKVVNAMAFFRLRGRTTSMNKSNVEFIPDLHYCYLSPAENRFYFKESRDYDLDTLFHCRPTLTFSGDDEAVRLLRDRIMNGNVYLLLTKEQIADTTAMLERVWKSQFNTTGKLDYRIFIELLKTSIEYEDYKDWGKNLTGFRTVCKQYDTRLVQLWEQAHAKGLIN